MNQKDVFVVVQRHPSGLVSGSAIHRITRAQVRISYSPMTEDDLKKELIRRLAASS